MIPINYRKKINELNTNGYTKVKNFLKIREVNEANKRLSKIKESKKLGTLWAPHNYDAYFIKLICKEEIQKILIPVLNDPFYKAIPSDKPNYILGEFIGIQDQDSLNLHIDSWIPSSSKRTWMVQVVLLLDDRKKEHGCTIAIKKSHRSDSYSNRNAKNYIYLEGNKGDLIIWDSRLWHGRNEGKVRRKSWALCATMQSWFIKQRFDYTKSLPKHIFSKLNKVEKQIMGFCSIPPKSAKISDNMRRGYEVL